MIDIELPQAAIEAGAVAHWNDVKYSDEMDWVDLDLEDAEVYRHAARVVLKAALPHLLTEVKSMCETATALGLALGRKQALVDAEAAILAFDYDRLASVGLVADVRTVHTALAKIVRDMASQAPQPVPNGLTASSRHPDTPEDTKPPQEGA